MQTTGAVLLAVESCTLVRTWTTAQDGRSALGLLYFSAVRPDACRELARETSLVLRRRALQLMAQVLEFDFDLVPRLAGNTERLPG